MAGFWDALFAGKNDVLNTNIGQTGQVAGYGIGQGEKNLSTASDFWSKIVGGDASKQAQALASPIAAAKTSTAEDMKTRSLFSPRSGGTAASNAASSDTLHGYITKLLGDLTGGAVSGLASTGTSELGTGLEATGAQAEMSQIRLKNWEDSIFGRGLTTAAATGEAMALGA